MASKLKEALNKQETMIVILLGLLVVVAIGWVNSPSDADIGRIQNRENIFHGYEAYLDSEIEVSRVSGNSMRPTFETDDIILWVANENMNVFEEGDIVIYDHLGELTVHRIIDTRIDRGDLELRTKGDNSQEEYWVAENQVYGLVIGVIYS